MRLAVFIAAGFVVYFALKRVIGDWGQPVTRSPNRFIAWFAVACAAGLIFGTPYFGTRVPGSFLERADYSGRFFVYLFPAPTGTVSYRVPAFVESVVRTEDDQSGSSSNWREYWLRYAVMPNGGTIRFDDCQLKLRQLSRCTDADIRSWGIRLTHDSAP